MRTLEEIPEGATHWSKRELAKRVGISPTSVHRIWRAFGLQPWRTENFKISPDPLLIDKIRDVVGLYLAPPDGAVVFAVDEKPQIQALERTAPVLPMIPGAPERRSFDYVRHGTIDLFAALNTATGKVIGRLSAQHRAVDFRDFLDDIDRQTRPGLDIHVICDNLSAHKAPAVHKWLLAHPRVQLHFTPTYSSWISQIERWFAELQRRCLDRGVFCSLDELTTALEDWIKIWNANARPFKWTKTADQIIDRICRYCSPRVQQVPPGGQHHRRRVELAGKLTASGHAGCSPAPGVPQVPGRVAERVPRGETGLAPCGQRRAGAGLHAARNCGDVLQVAAHDGDHVQQAVGNFLNVLAAAIGLVACYSGAGVAAGRRQEVAERGPRGHGPVLSSPQMSRALWAAFRQAASSPVSGAESAACVRRSATRWLSPATTSATRSGGSPDQGCCSAGAASSGCPGSEGARARALRPSAADAAAITKAANRPLAGS